MYAVQIKGTSIIRSALKQTNVWNIIHIVGVPIQISVQKEASITRTRGLQVEYGILKRRE